ncbi:hypothetical protein WP1_239 [Pseudomonas phage WP1]
MNAQLAIRRHWRGPGRGRRQGVNEHQGPVQSAAHPGDGHRHRPGTPGRVPEKIRSPVRWNHQPRAGRGDDQKTWQTLSGVLIAISGESARKREFLPWPASMSGASKRACGRSTTSSPDLATKMAKLKPDEISCLR